MASFASFAGLTFLVLEMVLGYGVTGPAEDPYLILLSDLRSTGLFAATVGIIALGIATITARVLPWWCGAAILIGSPPSVFVGLAFLGAIGDAAMVALGLGWVVVGFALLRRAVTARQSNSSPI